MRSNVDKMVLDYYGFNLSLEEISAEVKHHLKE